MCLQTNHNSKSDIKLSCYVNIQLANFFAARFFSKCSAKVFFCSTILSPASVWKMRKQSMHRLTMQNEQACTFSLWDMSFPQAHLCNAHLGRFGTSVIQCPASRSSRLEKGPTVEVKDESVTAEALPFLVLDSLVALSTATIDTGVDSNVRVSDVFLLLMRA
jgi:hypothetical protein